MRAILLAAGKGTRISRMIEAIPKCTLPINGVPLIRRTVNLLAEYGIESVVCVGYQKEKVYEALEGVECSFVFNPFYSVTNSIASMWFARDYLDGDVLIMNADVYVSRSILELIMKNREKVVMAIDKTRIAEGDYFFKITDNGSITKYGKGLPIEDRSCEYVGVSKMQSDFVKVFSNRLIEMIDKGEFDNWWEDVLYSLTETYDINTIDVENNFWSEIDYFDDYERILKHIERKDK